MSYYKNRAKFPADWKNCRISDIGPVIGGGTPSTKIKKYYGGKIPWITPKDLSKYNEVYIEKGKRNITEEGLSNSSARLMPEGTVLFTSRAPIGYVAIAKNEISTNQGFKNIICNPNVNNKFIYYWLKHNKENIERFASGSTFKEISGSVLKNIKIILPSYIEQKEIARVLFSLDSKIELNRKMNKSLEAIAQAIFKHWFIDFEFPNEEGKPYESSGGEMVYNEELRKNIPKGWKIERLGNIFNITDYTANGSFANLRENVTYSYTKDYAMLVRQVDFNNGWNGKYVYVDKHSYDFLKKSSLEPGDVMVSNIGNIGIVFRVPDLGMPMTGAPNVLIIKAEYFQKDFVYFLLSSDIGQNAMKSIKTGSAQPKFNKTDFRNLPFIFPTSILIKKFHHITKPFHEKIMKTQIEIKTLEKIRDSLLPKLMSGKIRIPLKVS